MELINSKVKFPREKLITSVFRRFTVGVLLLSTIVTPNDAAAQPSKQPGLVLPDGQWTATAKSVGPISGSNFTGSIIYNAAFTFTVTDGVVEGGWDMIGFSWFSGEGFTGNGQFVIHGVLEGSADEPVLRQTGGEGTGTAMFADGRESSGPISAGSTLIAPITLQEVTCDSAKGNFKIPADMSVASGGASSDLTATFVARRFTEIPSHDMEIYSGEVTALTLEGMDLSNAVAGGAILDYGAIDAILGRAEALYRELGLVNGCDRRNAGEFINSLQNTIAALINTALDHPDQFSNYDMARLISAAIRVGLIGVGAADPDLASEYEEALRRELERRLEEGIDDCVDAGGLIVGADLLGAAGLHEVIQADLVALCP